MKTGFIPIKVISNEAVVLCTTRDGLSQRERTLIRRFWTNKTDTLTMRVLLKGIPNNRRAALKPLIDKGIIKRNRRYYKRKLVARSYSLTDFGNEIMAYMIHFDDGLYITTVDRRHRTHL